MIYTGYLNVEPDTFSLRVDRIIVKSQEISFDCYGRVRHDHSNWKFSGTAFLQPEGHYRADDTIDGVYTSVYIFKPNCSVERCILEGFWYEKSEGYDPEISKFSGILDPF